MNRDSLKIGLFGAGHFGKLHLKNLLDSPFKVVGFFDTDTVNGEEVAKEFGVPLFSSAESLMAKIDVADIVVPTSKHIEIADLALLLNKHMFIEKPIASFAAEGRDLIERLRGTQLKVQVGQIERYNPAYKGILDHSVEPSFIESRRLAAYNPRANDVSVIHDLMIHDIDAVLALVRSEVKQIWATGRKVLTEEIDFCEARIEFENGCIANFLASRMHHEQERLMQVYGEKVFLSIDFLNKASKVISLVPKKASASKSGDNYWLAPRGTFYQEKEELNFPPSNAILEELNEFYSSIVDDKPTRVDQNDAFKALFIADKIHELAIAKSR